MKWKLTTITLQGTPLKIANSEESNYNELYQKITFNLDSNGKGFVLCPFSCLYNSF